MYDDAGALTNTRELNQGDILGDAPQLLPGGADNHIRIDDPRKRIYTWPVPPESMTRFERSVRVVQAVNRATLALVVSNSCDNCGGDVPLLLARVVPFDLPPEQSPVKTWAAISSAATGTSSPKYFYLPASPKYGLARSEAHLGEMYSVSHQILKKYADEGITRRVCTLKPAAVRHLQWQISVMFSRNPREDDEWPSEDDLRLKMAWLQEQVDRGVDDDEGTYANELARLRERFPLTSPPGQS